MESAVVYTRTQDSAAAGGELAAKLRESLPGEPPGAVIVFASPRYDARVLLGALMTGARPGTLVGASSAGEFAGLVSGVGMACALALRSGEIEFAAACGTGISRDPMGAAQRIATGFNGTARGHYLYRSALVMTDALAGHTDELIDQLTIATGGQYQFFGGGAGDNAQFRRTQVFIGTEALTDAAVALEILSSKPIGIGVSHGWEPTGKRFRVTEAEGMRLVSLNGLPAIEAFESHARETGQKLDAAAPIPFFLHNILGIETGEGYRLRVPLAIHEDGSIACASEVPAGAAVSIMRSSSGSAVSAAERATEAALRALGGARPKAALFFDCVATRLRLGEAFGTELGSVTRKLGDVDFAGCNTHGQIARAEGQFGGFHNCTAVVCLFPE